MKHNILLVIASVLSILFMTFHLYAIYEPLALPERDCNPASLCL